jgi:thiol-disulfide isomerase/thioredoxin
MMRKALVLVAIVVGVTLLLWAGWHNLRERRLAVERAEANHVTLMRVAPGQTAAVAAQAPGEAKDGNGGSTTLEGKKAPAFSLVDTQGKKVSLSDYKGRAVLVNFWATWCAPCKLEMPWFEGFRAKYRDQGFEVLGIAEDDAPKDEIVKTARRAGVTYPVLLTDNKIANVYGGIDSLPTSFYVNKAGVVVEETVGLAPRDEVEANIKKALGAGQ